MLRLDATVICIPLSEVKGYGRTHQRRRADTDQLSTISPKAEWQSLHEAMDFPLPFPSDKSTLVLPQNISTATEGSGIYSGCDNGNDSGGNHIDKDNNHDKVDKASSVDVNEVIILNTGQHTDPTGSTSILRPPLPPPFASTPRVSSPLYRPSTPIRLSRATELNETSHVAPPALHSSLAPSSTLTSPYGHDAQHTAAVRASLQRLVIYDDAIAATAQPQTSRDLPEARHQSQFHASNTTPSSRLFTLETSTPASWSRRHRRQAGARSPARMGTPGFVGLYGGLENSDETVLYDAEMWRWLASRRDG